MVDRRPGDHQVGEGLARAAADVPPHLVALGLLGLELVLAVPSGYRRPYVQDIVQSCDGVVFVESLHQAQVGHGLLQLAVKFVSELELLLPDFVVQVDVGPLDPPAALCAVVELLDLRHLLCVVLLSGLRLA